VTHVPRIAVTAGEPAGIGPDLCLALGRRCWPAELVVIGDPGVLDARAKQLDLAPLDSRYAADQPAQAGRISVEAVPVSAPVNAGTPDPDNAAAVLRMLDRAIDGCLTGEFDALVTCPVHKGVINDAGIPFSGHTEYLAQKTGADQVVMLLAAPGLRVALATTHLPLAAVPGALSREGLAAIIRCLHTELRARFGIGAPRILVAGLNPHAGEGGHLGREETDIIEPVLQALRGEGIQLEGPLPADTLFTPPYLQRADAVLAMYHDQGLPVLKHLGFGRAVNVTLGLPMLRTSVDHGTALELAGSGKAAAGSLFAAIEAALDLAGDSTP